MSREQFKLMLDDLIGARQRFIIRNGCILFSKNTGSRRQSQTSRVFSDKWNKYDRSPDKERLYEMQKQWYLKLYGFKSEDKLANFLKRKKVILMRGAV
jgi:hypothetical protein